MSVNIGNYLLKIVYCICIVILIINFTTIVVDTLVKCSTILLYSGRASIGGACVCWPKGMDEVFVRHG